MFRFKRSFMVIVDSGVRYHWSSFQELGTLGQALTGFDSFQSWECFVFPYVQIIG